MPDTEYFNPNGRAFPDVSALSTNFEIVTTNITGVLSGTSAGMHINPFPSFSLFLFLFPFVSRFLFLFSFLFSFPNFLHFNKTATPTFAAIVSLLNDARYQAGKKPLGFINPWLYQLGKVGTDILQGDNKVLLSLPLSLSLSLAPTSHSPSLSDRSSGAIKVSLQQQGGMLSLGWGHPTFKHCWLLP